MNESTTISNIIKQDKSTYVVRKNLAKDYEIEIEASEAPIINKMITEQEPYETSMADIKILEDEIFPISDAIKRVFGDEVDLNLHYIKLAIGGSKTDYITIEERDLLKYDVKPSLNGLIDFIRDNKESILGFLNRKYINEEGNVIYLNCSRKNVTDNILSLKIKIISSMQQRGFFLQQEHKYYGLQMYIIIESLSQEDEKIVEFLRELDIDWKLITFKRGLYINDWTVIECENDVENLKSYLRTKYDNLNYFDIKNISRLVVKNQLPFVVCDKMASLLFKMKKERALQFHSDYQEELDIVRKRQTQLEHEIRIIKSRINEIKNNKDADGKLGSSKKVIEDLNSQTNQKNEFEQDLKRVNDRLHELEEKVRFPEQENSITLKKAEIVAAARLACAYLGEKTKCDELKFDSDISIAEIMKYQEELTNI